MPVDLAGQLQRRWKELDKRSSAIQAILWDLEESFNTDDIQTSKAYLVLDAKLSEIQKEADFIFNTGVFKEKE